jgi:hypothetical protein
MCKGNQLTGGVIRSDPRYQITRCRDVGLYTWGEARLKGQWMYECIDRFLSDSGLQTIHSISVYSD